MQKDKQPCFVCTRHKGLTDGHHVLPIEYGGPRNGKLVPLCAACHRGVHREADARYSGKKVPSCRTHLEDLPKKIAAEANNRFSILVDYIREMRSRHDASGKVKADEARNMVSASLSSDELAMLHSVKQRFGMTNISKVITRLIVEKYMEFSAKDRGIKGDEQASTSYCREETSSHPRKRRQRTNRTLR